MKLSQSTLTILNNYATINSNIVFNSGNTVKTMSEAKNILSSAQIEEEFPFEIGVYDLSEFLSVLAMFDDPNIECKDSNFVITSEDNLQKIEYYYSDKSVLTSPSKDINMPDPEVSVTLTDETLKQIKRSASILGHNEVAIRGDNGVISVLAVDGKDHNKNNYSIVIDQDNPCKDKFNFVISVSNLKLLNGDYDVALSSKLISQFTNNTVPVTYWLALEKNSKYGE